MKPTGIRTVNRVRAWRRKLFRFLGINDLPKLSEMCECPPLMPLAWYKEMIERENLK